MMAIVDMVMMNVIEMIDEMGILSSNCRGMTIIIIIVIVMIVSR